MDSIKKFILGNLRYILSGILLILIVIVLVQCTDREDKPKEPKEKKEDVVAVEDEQQPEPEPPANDLVQDAYPEVNSLVQSYFDAKAAGDIEALRLTVSELSDTEADSVVKMSQHIESYNNIVCYTKNGPAENSYVAYICYDIKFQNVDTMAPSLNMLYVCSAEDGSLYINNSDWDADTEAAISDMNEEEEVQSLVSQVEDAYANALAQDEKLQNLASMIQSAASPEEGTEEGTPEASAAEDPAQQPPAEEGQETVYAKDTVNVRSQADENSERVGQIAKGDMVKRVSQDENGWSQIIYNNAPAYVKSEFLTANQEEVAAAQAPADSPSSGPARIVETAKMRKGEDTGSELIETLFPGTNVEVVEKYGSGRTKIKYNGKVGYVNSECVGK